MENYTRRDNRPIAWREISPESNPLYIYIWSHLKISRYATRFNDLLELQEKVVYIYYVSFWVVPRCLNYICRRFGTLYLFLLLYTQVDGAC